MRTDGRSLESGTWIETESGKKSGGSEKRSALNGRTRKDENGGKGTMERVHSGSVKRISERKKPLRKRKTKAWWNLFTPRSQRNPKKKTKRRTWGKKRDCGTRYSNRCSISGVYLM